MTTNVVDTASSMLASDSRWSFPVHSLGGGSLHALIYVDDAEFDKIEVGPEYSFIFAGDSGLMEAWKAWHRDPNRLVVQRPAVGVNFSLCLIDMAKKEIKFEHGQRISGSDHRFAGTGALPAYECWIVNKSATRAVDSACKRDIWSGGAVKYLDLNTRKHNVVQANVCKSINRVAEQKGMVIIMGQSASKAVPVADAAASDPLVREALKKVSSGSVAAQAPAGHDPIVWTDTDVARLDAALQDCFGVKKK